MIPWICAQSRFFPEHKTLFSGLLNKITNNVKELLGSYLHSLIIYFYKPVTKHRSITLILGSHFSFKLRKNICFMQANQISEQSIYKETRLAEHEYILQPPPP